MYRRLGGVSSPLGRPPETGRSFRFVRASAARFLDVNRTPSEKHMRDPFPFSLFAQRAFPFPFRRAIPFPCEI